MLRGCLFAEGLFAEGCTVWDHRRPQNTQHSAAKLSSAMCIYLSCSAIMKACLWSRFLKTRLLYEGLHTLASSPRKHAAVPGGLFWQCHVQLPITSEQFCSFVCVLRLLRQGCSLRGCTPSDSLRPQNTCGSTWKPILTMPCQQRL